MTDKTPKPTQANRDAFADTSVLREALGVKGAREWDAYRYAVALWAPVMLAAAQKIAVWKQADRG